MILDVILKLIFFKAGIRIGFYVNRFAMAATGILQLQMGF